MHFAKFYKINELQNKKYFLLIIIYEQKNKKSFKLAGLQRGKQQTVQKREKRAAKPGTQKTVKQLLGELYADKTYLEKLLNDDSKLNILFKKDRSVHSKLFFVLT